MSEQKEPQEAREFWLAQRYDDRYEAFELPCGDYSNWKGAVKVIEKSAYDKAVEALKEIVNYKWCPLCKNEESIGIAEETLRELGVD